VQLPFMNCQKREFTQVLKINLSSWRDERKFKESKKALNKGSRVVTKRNALTREKEKLYFLKATLLGNKRRPCFAMVEPSPEKRQNRRKEQKSVVRERKEEDEEKGSKGLHASSVIARKKRPGGERGKGRKSHTKRK